MKLLLVLILTFLAYAFAAQPDVKYVKLDNPASVDLTYNRNSVLFFQIDSNSDKEYRISYVKSPANSPSIENIVLNSNSPNASVKFSSDGVYQIKNNVNDKVIDLKIENLYLKEKNHKENDVLGKEYKDEETYAEYNQIAKRIDEKYNNNKKSNNDNLSNQQNDIAQLQVTNEQQSQQNQQNQQNQQSQQNQQVNNGKAKSDAKSNTDAKSNANASATKSDAKSNTDTKSNTAAAAAGATKSDTKSNTAPKTDAAAPKTDAAAPKTQVDNKADGNTSSIVSASIQMVAIVALSLVIFF